MQNVFHVGRRLLVSAVMICVPAMMLAQSGDNSSAMPQHDKSGASTQSGMDQSKGQNSSSLTASDKKFVREAAEGGLAEVELGQLAAEKASSEEVKKFGQRMVDDHSKANDQLKQIASSKGVTVPDKVSAKDKMLKERLSKLSGPSFDKAYMQDMVKDHKKDVAEFKRESMSAKDNDVKDFAAKTLPTLKEHLQQAEGIAPSAKTSSKASPAKVSPTSGSSE